MPELTNELARAEAERRIRCALDHIQNAQMELGRAAAELSNIDRGCKVWAAVGKLYDRVHAMWYRVDAFRKAGRFDLDSLARQSLAQRLAAQPEAPRG